MVPISLSLPLDNANLYRAPSSPLHISNKYISNELQCACGLIVTLHRQQAGGSNNWEGKSYFMQFPM